MSFHEKTESLINQACVYELAQAILEHGDEFHSMHEGWAVLKEEVEEADFNLSMVKNQADGLWLAVKEANSEWGEKRLKAIQGNAIECMKELAQVWAVCEKMKKGLKND